MSEFDRRTGVKKLRVKGMPVVRFCAKMKAAGLNILRAGAVRKARRKAEGANGGLHGLIDTTFTAVKKQFLRFLGNLESVFLQPPRIDDNYLKMAA